VEHVEGAGREGGGHVGEEADVADVEAGRVVDVDPGAGAYVVSGDWDDVATAAVEDGELGGRRFVVDQKGRVNALVGADTPALLGYGTYAAPLVPSSWLDLFDPGVALSQEAALCPPLIKYAGSKRWLLPLLLPRLHAHLANVDGVYVEPFCGGMAMGLGIGWPRSIYADTSPDLANLYRALQTDAGAVADEIADLARRGEGRELTWADAKRKGAGK